MLTCPLCDRLVIPKGDDRESYYTCECGFNSRRCTIMAIFDDGSIKFASRSEDFLSIHAFCRGVLSLARSEPYISAVQAAESEVGQSFNDGAIELKKSLVEAIKYNLVNQREYPFQLLQAKYSLPMNSAEFTEEKNKFCRAITRNLKLT